MKIRFLIQRDGPQDLHWYSGPSHFRTGFMCLLVAFFPGTVEIFSVPHPPTLSTSWWWVMRWSGGTGPFGGCLAVSLMDMMGKKSRSTLSGKHSKSRNVSAVLSPTSSAASSSTGCQDKHTVPDRAELAHPPWKAFLDALTHPPLSQDPGNLVSIQFSLYYIAWWKTECILLRSGVRTSTPTASTDYYPGDSSQCDQVRKGNTRHLDYKARSETVFADDIMLYDENPKEFTK